MYELIQDRTEIDAAETQLARSLSSELGNQRRRKVTSPAGTDFFDVWTNGEFWATCDRTGKDAKTPRFLNFFGKWTTTGALRISVEINIAFDGRVNSVAGLFARDIRDGSVYLMHSGRIGGGQRGVGKESFLCWSGIDPQAVHARNGNSKLAIPLMRISNGRDLRHVISYASKVSDFREAVKAGATDTKRFRESLAKWKEYYSESSGIRTGKRKRNFSYITYHGDVVDAVAAWRKKLLQKNERLVKNCQIDLGVAVGHKLSEVYEVKTDCSRQSIYTAVGQLIVHSGSSNCSRYLVAPNLSSLPTDISNALRRLGIRLIDFRVISGSVALSSMKH